MWSKRNLFGDKSSKGLLEKHSEWPNTLQRVQENIFRQNGTRFTECTFTSRRLRNQFLSYQQHQELLL